MLKMSLLFSRQCEYALQAVLYLAKTPPGNMTSIKEMSGKLDIPYHYLGKILQSLTYKGLLRSIKGRTGGFALTMPVEQITLLQVIDAVDGPAIKHTCVMGFGDCSEENPCALHNEWVRLRTGLFDVLNDKNVIQLAKEMKKPVYEMLT
jgi:Rrf2 family transcriptional regulator, iron-sulfur cluster assembly transcription factor